MRNAGKGRNRHTPDDWDAAWERLKREGRVDVPNPESFSRPYFPSSCDGLARAARGETTGILSVRLGPPGTVSQDGSYAGTETGRIRRAE